MFQSFEITARPEQGPPRLEALRTELAAEGLDGFSPASVSLTAGRVMIRRIRTLAARNETFGFETTLASRVFAVWIDDLRTRGYEFLLFFVGLQNSDIAVARVAERVQLGGHHVDEPDIRRRFRRGLRNFFLLYRPLADRWWFYDSSDSAEPVLVAHGCEAGTSVVLAHRWSHYKGAGDDRSNQ